MENMKHFPDVDVTKKGFVCPGCFLFDRQCSQLKGKTMNHQVVQDVGQSSPA